MKKYVNGEYIEMTQEEIDSINTCVEETTNQETETVEEKITRLQNELNELKASM